MGKGKQVQKEEIIQSIMGKEEVREMTENDRWEKQVAEARKENEVWEIVNRERKRRNGINKEISMGVWKEHFMGLLGRVERRIIKGSREGKGDREEGNKEGNDEEIRKRK